MTIDPIQGYCWPSAYVTGPTLTQHWINGSCLLGDRSETCDRGCAYTMLQTVQMTRVCSAVYGTVHYKDSLVVIRKE